MECFCGCGTKLSRGQVNLNLRAGEVAVELLAWSKALSTSDMRTPETFATQRLVDDGGDCFRHLLATMHGEREALSLDESDRWLARSRSEWRDREEMVEKGSFMRRPKLRLTEEDLRRLDRTNPERSFVDVQPAEPRPDADIATQLERLGALRAEGILTEEEFRDAKARVIGR